MALTPKQQLFVSAYLTCWNATKAARLAGYSEKYLHTNANKILQNPLINDAVNSKLVELKVSKPAQVASRKKNRASKYVYLIGAENGLVKIGVAVNVADRLRFLDTASPVGLHSIFYFRDDDAKKTEGVLHRQFSAKRVKGEWFELSPDDIDKIITVYGKTKTTH